MDNDPRYAPIDAVLPKQMPAVTKDAILPFYNRLVAAFMKDPDDFSPNYTSRAGKGYMAQRATARTCWASTKPTSGEGKGWGRMVHDASHIVFRLRHPNERPHGGGHAKLERQMAEYVMAQGWLVKPEEVPAPVVEPVQQFEPVPGFTEFAASLGERKPPKRAPESRQQVIDKMAAIETRIKRWQSKAKRAETAIKKLTAKRKRLLKKMLTA